MKIGFIYILFLFAIYFYGCDIRPVSVLSDKKMGDVLFDLYIAEAIVKNKKLNFCVDSVQKDREILFYSVLSKHRVSEQTFNNSLEWYNSHLKNFIKINEQLYMKYILMIRKTRKKIKNHK